MSYTTFTHLECSATGEAYDANAVRWNQRGIRGAAMEVEGSWEYRWKNPGDTGWTLGVARVRISGDRIFILGRDTSGKYLIECRFGANDRLIGRYVNLNDPDDTASMVLKIAGHERIDGYWGTSRWDFRRVAEHNAPDL